MLQRLREWLVLLLIIGLPFHAFLVIVGTRLIAGPGHAPLAELALWKEAILGLVLFVVCIEWLREKSQAPHHKSHMDILDWLIISLLVLGIFTTNYKLLTTNSLYGFKYTLFPLLLFLILRRVPWSQHSFQLSAFSFQLVGALVAAYGILTLFLPESFFTWLGYSDLHSLYLPDGPIAAFQKVESTGIRRIQSTFSGPNQLGMWLLIPWSMALSALVRKAPHPYPLLMGGGKIFLGFLALVGIALFLTFSRAAWIGAAVIVSVPLTTHYKLLTRWKLLGYWVIGFLGMVVIGAVLFPELLLRTASSREHWRRPMEAIRIIAAHPLGLGLGSAGPASNRTSDPCVFLEGDADISWAKDRPNLCVFSDDVQVQPAGRVCQCPFLPENWYLQVGVELGVFGLLLFMALVLLFIRRLLPTPHSASSSWPRGYSLLPFLGISVAALFLHAWEDSAVAYTLWILLAIDVPSPNGAWLCCGSRLWWSVCPSSRAPCS